jgi:hypothetical protein
MSLLAHCVISRQRSNWSIWGYSQAHDAYFGLGEMYIGGTNSPDWIFHGMSLRVFAPFCGELRKGNTSTRRESACLQTKRWWAL